MSKMITARLDDALLREVDRERADMSRAAVLKEALRMWLDRRRLHEAVEQHRKGYEQAPVQEDEFGPLIGAHQWPE